VNWIKSEPYEIWPYKKRSYKSDRIKDGRIKNDRIKTDRIKRITDPTEQLKPFNKRIELNEDILNGTVPKTEKEQSKILQGIFWNYFIC
jgi:hypothetical protein